MKADPGRFFEDFSVGETIVHGAPRTLAEGERALYHALYPSRHALSSSDPFAIGCGFEGSPLDDLLVFHVVLGKSVPDISLNALANLGYAQGRWLAPVYPGDTLNAVSEILGVKQNSSGKSGVVWLRSTGFNQRQEPVLSYVRWVMVRKGDPEAPAPETVIPDMPDSVEASSLVVATELDFSRYEFDLAGEAHRFKDYQIGEKIDHLDGQTIEEAEHMMATRLWQNTARVHFDATAREDGKRLIYGGHVMSMARALSFNGLANAQLIAGLNGGSHANPCFAGDTIRAWSEVLDKADIDAPGVGAIRLRLVATKGEAFVLRSENGKYHPDVLLDMDYWALMPL